ncbi:MAG: penicillin-binding protein 2 [Brockia lithotrophica]|nr:penicillin-binding protein 2 [Brockia lithotrophica]
MTPRGDVGGGRNPGNARRAFRMATYFWGVFVAFLVAVIGRVLYVQEVLGPQLLHAATEQWVRSREEEAPRGSLLDRNGERLAYDVPAFDVVALLDPRAPEHVEDLEATARVLARGLDAPEEAILRTLREGREQGRYQVEFRPYGWKLLPHRKEALEEELRRAGVRGIAFRPEVGRYYPKGEYAAYLLGYVNRDGKAEYGLEAGLDATLRGTRGKTSIPTDNRGVPLPYAEVQGDPAHPGKDVVLTLDVRLQAILEEALREADEELRPKGIWAVLVDPWTMEVLAAAARPTFDPNRYEEISEYTNPFVGKLYEPGSTFKVLTLAAAIEEGVYRDDDTYQAGVYAPPEISPPIRDWSDPRGWGKITLREGIVRSSNVAAVILGYERLGRERLARYEHAFGVDELPFSLTGHAPLPGSVRGRLPDFAAAPPRDVATTTYGQGLEVTSFGLVRALSAAVTDGVLRDPVLVKCVRDADTGTCTPPAASEGRRVVSPETAAKVREILADVVARPEGTGHAYAVEGYRIGGKTGTAQKVDPRTGRYEAGRYVYSFYGFLPVDRPRFALYIAVDEPERPAEGSGEVVAPIFRKVVEQAAPLLGVERGGSGSPEGEGRIGVR